MNSQSQDEWPEQVVCARCGVALGNDYRANAIGLRFCPDCYKSAVEEKMRERSARVYLEGRCSNCGGSLINGYRQNQFGVLYCPPCYDRIAERRGPPSTGEEEG
ncbi:hypothetical protein HZA56_10105 [Candidatus Poribacteria bacterium]|nr:hypothetical protein [Candidatus Poribacteria bacterium]